MKTIFYKVLFLTSFVLISLSLHAQQRSNLPYQFAWLSDIHIVQPGSSSVSDLKASVADINSNKQVRFTIITGDIADFGEDSVLQLAKSILDSLKMPYYIVPGNHDTKWSESGATAFGCIFGHRNISFNYGNIEFIGFQAGPVLRRGAGYISPDDLSWVKKQCEQAQKNGKIIIPFDHYPLTNNGDMSNWYKLTSLFRKYHVPMILSGHWHRYRLVNTGGIPDVVTRTNRSRGNVPVGYTIVKVIQNSMFFYKREPTVDKTTLWQQLSYKPVDYGKKDIKSFKPDLSVNKKYADVEVKWKQDIAGGISSEVAISDNKLVVGDRSGILHCVSLATGKQLWQFKTGKAIFSTPAIGEGKVVFGSVDSYIYCVNLNDGKLIWKFKTDNYVLGCPAIKNGVVYIGASDWKFRALELQTGKLIWVFDGLKAWVQTKPVVYEGKVYFGCWDNYFYALDQKTGKLTWKWERSPHQGYPSAFYAPAACWPVAAHNRIFIAGPDMVLTAIDAQTGKTIWRIGKPKLNEALGVSTDGSKVFVKCTFDSTLLAYSTASDQPEVLWKTKADYGFDDNESPISEKNGVVYFTFHNGMIIAANSETGKILWEHRLGTVMLNGATPVNKNEVAVSDVDGNVELLRSR